MKTSNRLVIDKTGAGGFTLVELVVVVATVAVLAAVLLPALAGTKPNTQSFQCLENQRQLILAWQMYAQENSDILPPNDYSGLIAPRDGTIKNWVFGSMLVPLDSINPTLLVNPQLSLLALYNTNPAAYKCPADTSLLQGRPRVRSVSMNSAVGTIWYSAAGYPGAGGDGRPPGSPVGGGWLSAPGGDYDRTLPDPNYRTYGKITQMTKPGPSMTWVIMDENLLTINDGCVEISMSQFLIGFPANHHNGAAGVSFADGHTEMHKWLDAFAKNPSIVTGPVPAPPNSQDLAWIQPRTSAPR